MKKLIGQVLGGIFAHVLIVGVLGGIGMFVWNTGACGLIPTLAPIEYKTSFAIMLGIYIVNMFCKIWFNRFMAKKHEKMMIEKMFGKKYINKK
jgi:hypothetical protein